MPWDDVPQKEQKKNTMENIKAGIRKYTMSKCVEYCRKTHPELCPVQEKSNKKDKKTDWNEVEGDHGKKGDDNHKKDEDKKEDDNHKKDEDEQEDDLEYEDEKEEANVNAQINNISSDDSFGIV